VFVDAWDGELLRQPDLGQTLRVLATDGPGVLYAGDLGSRIVSCVRAAGGLLTREDLASYAPVVTGAQSTPYRGFDLRTPLAASGAGVLAPLLGELQPFDLSALEPLGAERLSLLAEASGRVWFRRGAEAEPGCTDHFSVADTEGNVVACTTTLQALMGSGVTVPGTGILLNNAMGLFVAEPGLRNSIGSGKPTVTNMCPTVGLRADGRAAFSSGASGARRIPSMLTQAFTLTIDHAWSLDRAVAAPRFHYERGSPLLVEEGLAPETLAELERRGYQVDVRPWHGTDLGGQAPVLWYTEEGALFGAPDPRRHGAAVGL
jgi:gamma-glutamyltranspeptidase / glutathione hydrolase